MKKSVELAQQIAAQRTKVEELLSAGNLESAKVEADALKALKTEFDATVAVEESKKKSFSGEKKGLETMANAKVAFNKAVRGLAMTDEEKQLVKWESLRDAVGTPGQQGVTPAKGGYLVPAETQAEIEKMMDQEIRLRNYCDVKETNYRTGTIPTLSNSSDKLVNFDELNTITEDDIDFGAISYECKNYGKIIPISNEVIEDANADIVAEVADQLVYQAVNTENDKILTLLNGLTGTAITDYEGIKTALNVTLKPAVAKRAIIVTNQSGLDYLDKVKDLSDRPLLSEHLSEAGNRTFAGHEIVVLANQTLPDDATDGTPFFVGDLKSFAKFVERKGVVIAVSQEAGFTKNAALVRAIMRFDVKSKFADSMVKLTYKAE